MLFQCWSAVFDAGPTLKQHWMNGSCLLGHDHTKHAARTTLLTRLFRDHGMSLHSSPTIWAGDAQHIVQPTKRSAQQQHGFMLVN